MQFNNSINNFKFPHQSQVRLFQLSTLPSILQADFSACRFLFQGSQSFPNLSPGTIYVQQLARGPFQRRITYRMRFWVLRIYLCWKGDQSQIIRFKTWCARKRNKEREKNSTYIFSSSNCFRRVSRSLTLDPPANSWPFAFCSKSAFARCLYCWYSIFIWSTSVVDFRSFDSW